MFSFLAKRHTIARADYNRWLIPPAALCIHLSIGQAYAWSVFNIPLTRLNGITASADGDWSREQVIWVFSLAIVCLGLSAALAGKWLETAGPRCAMFLSAICFSTGFFVSALGAHWHWISLIYIGYGVIGGCGLGLGYISPVSTLIRWFPDRPGMATGMAIMGFGGGAMIGAPLAVWLMQHFSHSQSNGVVATFVVMGTLYLFVMMCGAALVRVPPPNWQPVGFVPKRNVTLVTSSNVHVDRVLRTPQFYLLWIMLCLNVTAGIGILGKASDMLQDMFGVSVAAGSAFVGLLSLTNMLGRFVWSSASDYIGRRTTYTIFFGVGALLYALLPMLGRSGAQSMFIVTCAVIMTMYGGGFATIPAYLRDLFGTLHVGAIHGRLLTAWSIAGVAGPVLLTRWAEHQKQAGVARTETYNGVLTMMAGLLVVGLVANWCLRPVAEQHHQAPNA
ncbi:MAG: OFA family MFS transporter [Pirellulaceae bacterium]|nr:OFA family MFS transporter [Pirellulaceae bacterium]